MIKNRFYSFIKKYYLNNEKVFLESPNEEEKYFSEESDSVNQLNLCKTYDNADISNELDNENSEKLASRDDDDEEKTLFDPNIFFA